MPVRPHHRCVKVDKNAPAAVLELGKKQLALANERFHYLRAAVTNAYTFETNVPPDRSMGQLFPRQGIVFDGYRNFRLEPVLGIKLHPSDDGTIRPGDLKIYNDGFHSNWKTRQGGILYCVGAEREFWNIMLNYHATKPQTTGNTAWDALFARLKEEDFRRDFVPCMFFACESGCCEPTCPFLHDKAACVNDREDLLAARRSALSQASPRDLMNYRKRALKAYRERNGISGAEWCRAMMEDAPAPPEEEKIYEDAARLRVVCANPGCTMLRMSKEYDVQMKKCAKCKASHYCSSECQKVDWAAHKKHCIPYDELVDDDDYWNEGGSRKGEEAFGGSW